MTTTMIRPVSLPFPPDLDDLWGGPEPDPDPNYVDLIRVERALNPGRAGNREAWRFLSGAEQDELVRQCLTRRRPAPVTVMAGLLHVSNATVLDMVGRLFDPNYIPPTTSRPGGRYRRRRDRSGDERHDDLNSRPGFPVLAIRRPWAGLIIAGVKTVENRSWTTEYRGPVYVHAALRWEPAAASLATTMGYDPPGQDDHPTGIVGTVDVASMCHPRNSNTCQCGPWATPGSWHWHLTNPRPYTQPVPWVGRLGLRWPTPEQAALIEETRRYA